MKTPSVSVIMSVYKEPAEWIRQSIDSILNQTFNDFELIIVNDNPTSADNIRILNEYICRDLRISVITNETNLGLTKSLNKALAKAQGELIARIDADDISLPDRFEKQVAYLKSHPEIIAIGSWVIHIDENNEQTGDIVKYETCPKWVKAQFLQNSQVCHPASMFRRVSNGKVVQYDESMKYAQDYALWVNLLQDGDIANIPEPLLYLRTSNQQITSSKKSEQMECAERAQEKAFALFALQTDASFLSLFSALTIYHRKDIEEDDAKAAFCRFFNGIKLTKENSLALEIVYSTYLAFLRTKCTGDPLSLTIKAIKNSRPNMMLIGCNLVVHLLGRKLSLAI